jgi:hypothetical protein
MSTSRQRILQEKNDLDDNMEKLRAFIWDGSPIYAELPQVDCALLIEQLSVMRQYSNILLSRLLRA